MTETTALDTRIEVETPEGVRLHLLPAGVIPRALAWAIDFSIRLFVLWIFGIALALSGDAGNGLYLLLMFALLWLYPVLFELLWQGQTPGKRALDLRVINADGTPVGWVASSTRNLLRAVDMLPLGYGVGILSSLIDARGRRLGDLAAGTLVVHSQAPARIAPVLDAAAVEAPVGMLRTEREAVLEFAERHRQLSDERQIELAELLSPATGNTGIDAVRHLLGMARSLLGHTGRTP